jgi:hypothetical protein
MQVLLQLIVTLSLALAASSANVMVAKNSPGRLLLWSNQNLPEPRYITKTVNAKQASDYLLSQAGEHEVLVLLTPSSSSSHSSCMQHPAVKESMSKAADQNTFTYVYPSATGESIATMTENKVKEDGSYRKVSMSALADTLQNQPELFTNNKVDVIEIEVSDDQTNTQILLQALLELLNNNDAEKRVLFAAYDAVQDNVAKPAQYGGFARILQSTPTSSGKSSLNTDGIYYKPEGAEYAIYYADTYLYITPDIFTGLMTGIFVFFTLLTGISCLGSIQGMSSFYDKLPVVGKEA